MRIASWAGSSAGNASAMRQARSQLTQAESTLRLADTVAARMFQIAAPQLES